MKHLLIVVISLLCAGRIVAAESAAAPVQQGKASWYQEPQRLASGGRFNPEAMTAAHRTLPLGTLVRVTHLASLRSVVLRINDRGPYVKGRIIDVSRAAARELRMMGSGVARVAVEVIGRN